MLVLPRFQQKLDGYLIYLNKEGQKSALKKVRLKDLTTTTLENFDNLSSNKILGIDLYTDSFSPSDSFFVSVMHNPNIFYSIPVRARDIYIKKINSQLITQITSREMAYAPIWL